MIILAIESSTEVCSVALAKDGVVMAIKESREGRDHARNVARFANDLLCESGLKAEQLDGVAVSFGPGSYTGLRIGVSFAKGLCYGLNIPLLAVNTLEALVAQLPEGSICGEQVLVSMIDARRMEVYAQQFTACGVAQSDRVAMVIDEESFAELREQGIVIFGDGAQKCREVLPWARFVDVKPSAAGVAKVAHRAMNQGYKGEDVAYCEPFYLKEVMITKSKKKFF